MTIGRVALFDEARGRGFIATTRRKPRVYLDIVELIRSGSVTLAIGEQLEFGLHEEPDGGLRAVNLRAVPQSRSSPNVKDERLPAIGRDGP